MTHNIQISKFKFLCLRKYRALHVQKNAPISLLFVFSFQYAAPQNSLIISGGLIITFICCPQILSVCRCTLPPNADVLTFPKAQLKTQGLRRVSVKKGRAQIWVSALTVTTPLEWGFPHGSILHTPQAAARLLEPMSVQMRAWLLPNRSPWVYSPNIPFSLTPASGG